MQHAGLPKREDGEASNRSLLDMFRGGQRLQPQDVEEESASASGAKRLRVDEDKQDETGVGQEKSDLEEVEVAVDTSRSANAEENAKLDKILELLSRLQVPTAEISHTSADLDEISAAKILLQGSKSIQRICEIAKLTADLEKDILICDICCSDTSIKARTRTAAGIFHYDLSLGLDFTISNQPALFSNLKKSVGRHIANAVHQKNLLANREKTEQQRKLKAKEKSIGVPVGKQAYRLLKCCRPHTDFEINLVLLADAKVKIGNLNHSRAVASGGPVEPGPPFHVLPPVATYIQYCILKMCPPLLVFGLPCCYILARGLNHSKQFPSQLRPAFAQVLDSRLKILAHPLEATKNLPPVGVVADKLTTRRRTGQMFAAVLFTPGMPNLLSPVSMGVESVFKHDGDSIAEDIHNVCTKYNIQDDQIAGFGFDGQYFHLGVHTNLKQKMQLTDRVSVVWDAAHLLQLADKDMRKCTEWVDEICKDIGTFFKFIIQRKSLVRCLEVSIV